ncbi:MAG TPA: RHS repeat-associated core domain-containing protein, partial [Terriglobia bacterium]|nr:RHS repeat-associated core domain-containing protein [Terriglobia bacterium]
AGNQLNDIWSTYEYDAEGRVKHSYSSGQWQYPTYNALGQRVQDYQGIDPMTLTYPIDLFGQRTGAFAQWPSQNWTGWNVYWSQIAGQRLNMGGASAYIDHSDAVGSTTMETDPAGAVQWDVTHYPWGGVFQEQGARQSEVVMGLDWQVNDPVIPSATRELSSALGRWMTSDPLGGDVANPQSLNRYAYVGNNPTTLTDPLGLQSPQGLLKAEFRFHCLMDPVCNHWSSTGGYDYWTVGGYDVFDVMQIPVRASEWVPPQFAQSGDVLHLTTGHWETTTLGNATMVLDIPGINFTADSPTTGTFTSAFSFPQTVIKFKNSGFVQNVQDYADFFHPGQLDLRDKLTFCSAHVAINKSSGQVPRTPTTGDYHFDAINPWAQSPIPSVVDPSGLALPLGHLALDVLGLYPGSAACHP